ncbi:MAG: glycosyltransferase family 4 protein [Anaerolineae bacterium]|nr:glycosyltransferase family 4 protein [Anaerolineae bacterium]
MIPRIIFINQSIAPHIERWLRHFAAQYGPVEVWSGNAPPDMGVMITVKAAPAYDRTTALSRLRTWLHFALVVFWRLLLGSSRTPLFMTTNPPFVPLAVWLAHHLRGQRYGIYEFDIYPQIADVMGMIHQGNPFYSLWYGWHKRALRDAALVVTLSPGMARQLRSMMADEVDPPQSPQIIPNWVDIDWIKPVERADNAFAQAQDLGQRLVVAYTGNMGATHAIETILEVAEHLRAVPEILFLFIGDGTKRDLVAEAIDSGRLPNARLLPWISYDQLADPLASIDVSIVTLAQGYEHLSIPSKTVSALAAGSAILGISREPSDLAALLGDTACGANFAPEAVEAIADWLRSLAADRSQLRTYQRAARAAAVAHFNETTCMQALTDLIAEHLLEDGKDGQAHG